MPAAELTLDACQYPNSTLAGRFFSHYGDLAGHSAGSSPIGRLRTIGYIRKGYAWTVASEFGFRRG